MEIRSILRGLAGHEELLGHRDVCVAVLDGPVDMSHPCFAGADLTRIETLVKEPVGRGPMSLHGTHVASLLFGQPGSGVVGVTPSCRGLILPVFRDEGSGRVSQLDLARAIERAVEEGAHVINISGGERAPQGQADSILARALGRCEENGVLVVAAVGNDGCDCLQVPAAVASVLAVGGEDSRGEPLPSNNWGARHRTNAVLAPGQDIDGAAPGGGRRALTGSSFASPAVAGVAALLVALQLRQGRTADPRAAGRAILTTATAPSCSPDDAPHCRRYLAGRLHAARAYDLVAARPRAATAGSTAVPATAGGAPQPARQLTTPSYASGVRAASTPPPATPWAPTDEGERVMETQPTSPVEEIPAMTEAATQADAALDVPSGRPQAPPIEAVAEDVGAPGGPLAHGASPSGTDSQASQADVADSRGTANGESPLQGAVSSQPNKGAAVMEAPSTPPAVHAGGANAAGGPRLLPADTPSPGAGDEAVAGREASGVRAACGGAQDAPTGCACEANGARRQLIYAIGTIGYDFQTEARRDSFRQQMPAVTVADGPGRESELPPNPYDPNQLADYLARNPWVSDKVTWTLNMDSTPLYALQAEMPVGMDWGEPIAHPSGGVSQEDLAHLIETLSRPPVSPVYRILREAIKGQVLEQTNEAYVSRVSIPGILTDRTVRLYSGQVVPVVEVKSRGVYTWNESALVKAVMAEVKQEAANGELQSDEAIQDTVRAFFDKIYYQFRNLGQSSADRALNYAGTNGALFGSQLTQGLSGSLLRSGTSTLWSLDTITVSKSPYCRPGSDCQDVVVTFFDPENDRRAKKSYLFTIDVSDELPVSLAPVHHFLDR
ncbi:cyanobactin maturation protease PatG family protein [Streptomyces sp. NPDC001286]